MIQFTNVVSPFEEGLHIAYECGKVVGKKVGSLIKNVYEPSVSYADENLTPQSGDGVYVNNLSHALRAGINIPSGSAQLSMVDNTNPLNTMRAAERLAKSFEDSTYNKEEKS